jgi:hypothetical protein
MLNVIFKGISHSKSMKLNYDIALLLSIKVSHNNNVEISLFTQNDTVIEATDMVQSK